MSRKSSYLEKDERSDETPKNIPPHLRKRRTINDQLSSHAFPKRHFSIVIGHGDRNVFEPMNESINQIIQRASLNKTRRGGSEEGSDVTKF